MLGSAAAGSLEAAAAQPQLQGMGWVSRDACIIGTLSGQHLAAWVPLAELRGDAGRRGWWQQGNPRSLHASGLRMQCRCSRLGYSFKAAGVCVGCWCVCGLLLWWQVQ